MPDWAPELRRRLASARLSPTREAEMVEELSQHLDDRWHELVASGMDPDIATQTAIAQFQTGDQLAINLTPLRQASYNDQASYNNNVSRPEKGRWWSWAGSLMFDLRQAKRALTGAPGFTAVALAILTLSIGATTAIVSVVDAVILRRLPFPQSERLVSVGELVVKGDAMGGRDGVAPQNFLDWREQQDVFTGLAAVAATGVTLKPENGLEPEVLKAQAVTADFFSVLGVSPAAGRSFGIENEREGSPRVVVISHGLWQRRFGGSPDAIGKYLRGRSTDFQIAGVMPEGFAYPVAAVQPVEVWMPYVFRPEDHVRGNEFSYSLQVIGRLRPGVSIEQAQSRMDAITQALARETPRWFEDRVAKVEFLRENLTKDVRRWMLTLLAAVGFVLLIACVNLSNLMLARISTRTKEFAIRLALGASRWDLARSLLLESLLLSMAGAAFGVFLAWLGVELLRAAMPAGIPRVADIAVSLRVLAATAATAILTALMVSVAPMFHFSRLLGGTSLTSVSRASTANAAHQRLRGVLVVAEVALAVVLLVGSGLFLASFMRVTSVNLGIDPHDVLTVRIRPFAVAPEAQEQNRGLLRNVLERVQAFPGVEVASYVNGGIPLRGDLRTTDFGIPGRVLPPNEDLDLNEISTEYFRAIRVPLLKGRFFNNSDRQGSEAVAIINEAAARRYFPGEDAVGKVIRFEGLRTVVGVAGNIRHDGPEAGWRPQGFIPFDQSRAAGATLVLRLAGGAPEIVPAVKDAIWSQFPNVPLPDIQTLDQYLNALIAQRRFNMLLIGLFGLLGIVIALVGIYGVMAYVVAQRTREIGIRMALGAMPAVILRSVLGRASVYLSAGLAVGLAAAWGLSGLLKAFLFEIHPHDGSVYAGVGVMLVLTGLAAAFIPARRAAQVDPLNSLRLE